VPEVGRRVGILANTLHKAIRDGRLIHNVKKIISDSSVASTKSQRSALDKEAPMGYGTTRTLERMAAAIGMLDGAPIEFEEVRDVPEMAGYSLRCQPFWKTGCCPAPRRFIRCRKVLIRSRRSSFYWLLWL
jgi:hypothetical protein